MPRVERATLFWGENEGCWLARFSHYRQTATFANARQAIRVLDDHGWKLVETIRPEYEDEEAQYRFERELKD